MLEKLDGYVIDLNPDTEAKIKALAQSAGLSVEDFLLSLVSSATSARRTKAESKSALDPLIEFQFWVNTFSTSSPGISEEALRRESIYER